MNPNVLVAIITASSSLIVAVTALVLNHRGFADLQSEMNRRFDATDKRFDLLEEGVRELEDRLEHPVLR